MRLSLDSLVRVTPAASLVCIALQLGSSASAVVVTPTDPSDPTGGTPLTYMFSPRTDEATAGVQPNQFALDIDGDRVSDVLLTFNGDISNPGILGTLTLYTIHADPRSGNLDPADAGGVGGTATTVTFYQPGSTINSTDEFSNGLSPVPVAPFLTTQHIGVDFEQDTTDSDGNDVTQLLLGQFSLTYDPNSGEPNGTFTIADINYDDDPAATSLTVLPEPGSLTLIAFGSAGLLVRRRRPA